VCSSVACGRIDWFTHWKVEKGETHTHTHRQHVYFIAHFFTLQKESGNIMKISIWLSITACFSNMHILSISVSGMSLLTFCDKWVGEHTFWQYGPFINILLVCSCFVTSEYQHSFLKQITDIHHVRSKKWVFHVQMLHRKTKAKAV
jgi:hypothetical protein